MPCTRLYRTPALYTALPPCCASLPLVCVHVLPAMLPHLPWPGPACRRDPGYQAFPAEYARFLLEDMHSGPAFNQTWAGTPALRCAALCAAVMWLRGALLLAGWRAGLMWVHRRLQVGGALGHTARA